MAASRIRKGKSIFALTLTLLLADLFYFPPLCCVVLASPQSDPSLNSNSPIETDAKNDIPFRQNDNPLAETCVDHDLFGKHHSQLEKLQELVQNLTQLVDRLESRLSDDPGSKKIQSLLSNSDEKIKEEDSLSAAKVEMRSGEPTIVAKYNTFWAEKFQFVSAVKLGSSPSCLNVLPNKDFEGLSKYFTVGDERGKLYVFLRSGEVALEFEAFSEAEKPSAISAVVSYLSPHKNETMIVTGHENGAIVMHRVWETLSGEEWSSLRVERVGRFEIPESWGLRINMVEAHHIGRRRYILATDIGGKIMVFKEDGTLYGTAAPSKRPVAFLKQRLLFLTGTGAGSLDLRTMKLKEIECEGWNSSFAKSYVFDATDRSKAYGLTEEGDLVQLMLLGDVTNFKCRVRSRRRLDMDAPLALQAIRGYVLVATRDRVYVYNVSSLQYLRAGGGLRLLFSAGLDEIVAPFLNEHHVEMEEKTGVPLIAGDHDKLVVISLGNGYVAMYRSNLQPVKNEINSILWTSPVLFFGLFLFGAWQCFANKKEALTSWGSDDPFTSASVTTGAPLGSATGDRSFTDTSRSSEIMDLRGSGLRGSSRYVSPPRYSGGGPNPYRTGGADADSRPAPNPYRPSTDADSRPATNHYRPSPDTDARPSPIDPRFRAAEMKYRGSKVEASAVPMRRETTSL